MTFRRSFLTELSPEAGPRGFAHPAAATRGEPVANASSRPFSASDISATHSQNHRTRSSSARSPPCGADARDWCPLTHGRAYQVSSRISWLSWDVGTCYYPPI